MIFELVAGVLLGVGFVALARAFGAKAEARIYALGLVVAALIYVGFALLGGAEPSWVGIEAAGLIPFTGFAVLGLRRSGWWLAAGWGMHPIWDVGLHLVAGTPAFVPDWYPVVCIGFDILVAGAIAVQQRGGTAVRSSRVRV